MTEPNTNTTAAPAAEESSKDDKGNSATKLLIGMSVLAVIVIAGIVFSIVILVRGDDAGPLVPADRTADGGNTQVEQTLFEQDPIFDALGRVVYVPLDGDGVVLPQSRPGDDRPTDQAPGGVMLQQIHGNMVVPFSTSDGPTRVTDSGVAAGFSRTPQGAGLAASHYASYLASGANRIQMLSDAGLLSDPKGVIAKSTQRIPDSSPSLATPMVKVEFNPDLSLVHLGYTADMADGSTKNMVSKIPLVWREGTGWVVKADSPVMGGGPVASFGAGWASWW